MKFFPTTHNDKISAFLLIFTVLVLGAKLENEEIRRIIREVSEREGVNKPLAHGSKQSPSCGIRSIRPDDPRTEAPWNAVIYTKSKSPDGSVSLRYFTTGVIIGPTTVFTVAGGPYGAVPRTSNSISNSSSSNLDYIYRISRFDSFTVGVGLASLNHAEADEFSQFSEVNFILPYFSHESSNEEYHYLIYHLKTVLDTRGDHVREICLPLIFQHYLNSKGSDGSDQNSEYDFLNTGLGFSIGGFAASTLLINSSSVNSDNITRRASSPKTVYQLTTSRLALVPEKECNAAYRYHYSSNDPSHVFCGRTENFCHLLGSPVTQQIVTQPAQRWFLVSLLTSTPRYGRKKCSSNKLSFFAGVGSHMGWIYNNYLCSPNKFACNNATCIPLSSLCNNVKDCPEGEDEDRIYCAATTRCLDDERQCGLRGKCIADTQVCDGTINCDDESDERNCKKDQDEAADEGSEWSDVFMEPVKCPSLNIAEGVQIFCEGTKKTLNCSTDIGSIVSMRCKPNFVPKYGVDSVRMICAEDGQWEGFMPFSCQRECGLWEESLNTRIPWLAEITDLSSSDGTFRISGSKNNSSKTLCSGTLIEKQFLLTSGECANALIGHVELTDSVKSSNASDNFFVTISMAETVGMTMTKASSARQHRLKAQVEQIFRFPRSFFDSGTTDHNIENQDQVPLEQDVVALIRLDYTEFLRNRIDVEDPTKKKRKKIDDKFELMPTCYKKFISDLSSYIPVVGEVGRIPARKSATDQDISFVTAKVIDCPVKFSGEAKYLGQMFCVNASIPHLSLGDGFFTPDKTNFASANSTGSQSQSSKYFIRGIVSRPPVPLEQKPEALYEMAEASDELDLTHLLTFEDSRSLSQVRGENERALKHRSRKTRSNQKKEEFTVIYVISLHPFLDWIVQTLEKNF